MSQLRAFASVAEMRSISRGAAVLGRSQPAVTQAIANLETAFGVTLFLRHRAGVVLTDAGLIVQNRVTRHFAEIREAAIECGAGRAWTRPQVDAMVNCLTRPLTTALLMIDELGSLPRAAHLLQQRDETLRKTAASLEAVLNVKLFNREPYGIRTNSAGKALAARLRLAMRELEAAREEVNAGFGIENGCILAGAMMLAGNQLMTAALQRFTQRYPQASVSVSNAGYDVLLDRLMRGSIDFVVGLQNRPSPAENVVEQVIAADPFMLAVRVGHPLTLRSVVRKADLEQHDWVLAAPGTVRRDAFDALFADVPKPICRVETHSIITILSLLANSDAIAILTQSELQLDQQLGGRLEALKFGALLPGSSIAMITRRGWLPTRLQTAFAQCVAECSAGKEAR
ncbi:LysR family transcriptional regulator [Novosphingobium flavum]|uniref:LysR family transcriptional regulator n=1 Tax=Novosphingobium flavum TaxID=1778672 RepID=A0A7X1FTE4_9SPHN|nr:LysR substrate-binding domain-containing protein [Novosphingobium flavum]MBC2666635.1 LysR family transcriptional regulator [Novosphingobium flavum]